MARTLLLLRALLLLRVLVRLYPRLRLRHPPERQRPSLLVRRPRSRLRRCRFQQMPRNRCPLPAHLHQRHCQQTLPNLSLTEQVSHCLRNLNLEHTPATPDPSPRLTPSRPPRRMQTEQRPPHRVRARPKRPRMALSFLAPLSLRSPTGKGRSLSLLLG